MKKKHKQLSSNYIDQWLILSSVVTGYISMHAFASLVAILVASSTFCKRSINLCYNCRN